MIIIVKVSARRWMVVESATSESAWQRSAASTTKDDGYIYTIGTILAGPADWQTCEQAAHEYAQRTGTIRTLAEWDAMLKG